MPADIWGFVKHGRVDAPKRPVAERLSDWRVVLRPAPTAQVEVQAQRCMDCGVAFCHQGCPLGNLIPEWNELVGNSSWRAASERLHATNNFPEFTGWICPAPCEPACVVALDDAPVAIKQIELAIVERAFAEGWVRPVPPSVRTGRKVAVVGSGPGGLAAAQQLTRAGHEVTVFERDDRLGGLLRYGIPDFKMDKAMIDRRLAQLEAEGTRFVTGCAVGVDVTADELREEFDAIVLACGALAPRELDRPGRHLDGVHQAMTYLPIGNRVQAGDFDEPSITAAAKRVVIIGGGDTAADCLGTANRQGAVVVQMLDHNPTPPSDRDWSDNPWPQWPKTHKHSNAHEEGVDEVWSAEVQEFVDDGHGRVRAVRGHWVQRQFDAEGRRSFVPVPDGDFELEAELVLLAAGFVGTEPGALLTDLGVDVDPLRGTVKVDSQWATSAEGVFACGDMSRGASLVVWAIAEARSCAAAVDEWLMGRSDLPAPVSPTDRPL